MDEPVAQWLELDGPLDPCHPPTLCPRVPVSSTVTVQDRKDPKMMEKAVDLVEDEPG